MQPRPSVIGFGRFQLSLLGLMAGVVLVALLLAAGSRFGITAMIPVIGVAALYFLTAISKPHIYNGGNKRFHRARCNAIAGVCLFLYCISMALPSARLPVLTESFSGYLCFYFAIIYFIQLGHEFHSIAKNYGTEMISLTSMWFSFLCSALIFVAFFQQPINNRWLRGLRECGNVLVGMSAAGTWLIPIAFAEIILGPGFYCWAVSINIARFAMTHSWTNFLVTYIFVLLVLIFTPLNP